MASDDGVHQGHHCRKAEKIRSCHLRMVRKEGSIETKFDLFHLKFFISLPSGCVMFCGRQLGFNQGKG